MRIGIVGSGISGLTAAWLLSRDHETVVYEAGAYLGGHTHTVEVTSHGHTHAIDTGFIVFNERTYPNFIALLRKLNVPSQVSDMSFGVSCARTGFAYCGSSLNTFFAQRRNLFRPGAYRLLRDIVRFNRHARKLAQGQEEAAETLGSFCEQLGMSEEFVSLYLHPMLAAIWSANPTEVAQFPAAHFMRFFHNHGLLDLTGRPAWRVIQGGSKNYVGPLSAPLHETRLNTPVRSVARTPHGVVITDDQGHEDTFDHVILALHSDQALEVLRDPLPREREILGAMRYQMNDVVLHTDTRLLPREKRAWASWNYRIPAESHGHCTLTYNMNRLQGLRARETFCVTLNQQDRINPSRILGRYRYAHPVYNEAAIAAQGRHHEISGVDRIHYCGAYWGYGFHEDGVNSALKACAPFGIRGV